MSQFDKPRLRLFESASGQRHIAGDDRYLYAQAQPRFRFNVIGTGTIGQEHMRVAATLGRAAIHGIFDPSPLSMQIATEEYEAHSNQPLKHYSSAAAAAADPEVDAVMICSPNHTHLTVLNEVMKGGKPIFLEKPMATTVADAAEIVRKLRDYKSHVQIGLQYRYKAPYVEALHELNVRRSLGDVKTLTICEYRPPFLDKVNQWNKFERFTGGTLVEKCCHYFDLLNLFAGGRPRRVFASGGQAVNFKDFKYGGEVADIADHAHVIVEYDNDVRAAFTLNMFSPEFREELVIGGSTGRLHAIESWDHQNSNASHSSVTIERPEPWARREISVGYPAVVEASGHHGATWFEHMAFIDQLEGKKTTSATPLEGLWSVLVAAAAQYSMQRFEAINIDQFILEQGMQDCLEQDQ